MLCPAIAHLEQVELTQANRHLEEWGHRMGPCVRPNADVWAHELFEHGRPVALCVTATLVRETCAGFTRDEAIELARLCAARPDLSRVMLRMWREFVFPAFFRSRGVAWAVSYQDEALHTGNLYRFDGWVPLGRSRSGTDSRSGRRGRNKTIWGWNADAIARASVAQELCKKGGTHAHP